MTGPAVTRRVRILAYLEKHPGQTAYEIGVALDAPPNGTCAGSVFRLLRDMERKAQVVAIREFRPQQGRQVNLWHLAPPGTPPPPASPPSLGDTLRYRARNRVNQRRSRARRHSPAAPVVPAAGGLPDGPACWGADPDLFFPLPGQSMDPAKAICVTCAVRAECLALARARGERFGIWGGVDLGAEPGTARSA